MFHSPGAIARNMEIMLPCRRQSIFHDPRHLRNPLQSQCVPLPWCVPFPFLRVLKSVFHSLARGNGTHWDTPRAKAPNCPKNAFTLAPRGRNIHSTSNWTTTACKMLSLWSLEADMVPQGLQALLLLALAPLLAVTTTTTVLRVLSVLHSPSSSSPQRL